MKKLNLFLIIGIVLCTIPIIEAQDLQLTYENKTNTIKAGTFIEVEIATPYQQPCAKCPINAIVGELISYADGILVVQAKYSREPLVENETQIGYDIKKYNNEKMPTLTIQSKDVLSIKIAGKKKIKKTTTGQTIGRVIFVLGLSHMISAPIAGIEDGHASDLLLALGAIEVISGMVINAVFDQKTYYTSRNSSQEGQGHKIWKLN